MNTSFSFISLKNFFSLIMAVMFLGSCQELEEQPILLEAPVEGKFDRDLFLKSVHEASLDYVEGIQNPMRSLNFRTVYDSDVVIHNYIESIASRMNTPQNYFKIIPEETWNDPYQGMYSRRNQS